MNDCLEKIITGTDNQALQLPLSPQREERAGGRREKFFRLYG
jgi:hypothetical protein